MHRGWDDELERLVHAQAAFGPDGEVAAGARAVVVARHPLAHSVRRHLLAALAWSVWSAAWWAVLAHWPPLPVPTDFADLLALLLWLAGLGVLAGLAVASRRLVLAARERYLHDLRHLMSARPEPGVSRRSASGGSAPGAPGRPG